MTDSSVSEAKAARVNDWFTDCPKHGGNGLILLGIICRV
jgi:hypothetical protein